MARGYAIAKLRFRRLYYIGVTLLIALTIVSFVIPAYVGTRAELSTMIDQLSSSIIDQKRAYLEAVIVEKIGDIERIRKQLESQMPSLSGQEFDQQFRSEVREMIHATELPDDGYIWINEIIDYAGGDNYAVRFAHPNLVDTEGDYLSTNITDIAGNRPYQEELEGIKQDGQIFFEYFFQKMGSDQISHKLSFAKLYAPYDWVVATGVYLDDVNMLIENETVRMIASSRRTVRNGVIAFFIGIFVLLIMTIVFETRIRLLIDSYVETERSISAQLLEEKSKLEDSNRQKDRMFSIIAHDLRSPIHALSAGIKMLDESETKNSSDLARTIVDELDTSATRVSSLLDQLLEWARSQQGTVSFDPKKIDLCTVIDETCRGVAPNASQKGIGLHNRCEDGTTIYADVRMLETIMRNLIDNAVKFTPEGGSVTIRSTVFDDAVEVSITDTGVGIGDNVRDRLFSIDSGYHTDGTSGEKGSGLGLDLCAELVRQHNGQLRVESTLNEGSTFSVILPFPETERTGT